MGCKRTEFIEPDYLPNFTESYIITAIAIPTTVRIYSDKRDVVDMDIQLLDFKGDPVPATDILLYIMNYKGVQRLMGSFGSTNSAAVIMKTDANGEIKTRYYAPKTSEYNKSYFYIMIDLIGTGQYALVPIYQLVPINCIY